MKIPLIITVLALFLLAACTTQELFPDNSSNVTVIELPDFETTEEESEEESEEEESMEETEEEMEETPVEEEPEETDERDTSDYDAVIETTEGELISLQTRATDPDGDEVELTFSRPFNDDGEWQTRVGDVGEYEVDVVASDGLSETEATILVIVNSANGAPVIEGPTSLTVDEGEEVDLGVFTITDPDGDEFITSYAGWMSGSTYETGFNDAGTHDVRVIAEDLNGNQAVHELTVTVNNVNRRPRLTIEDRTLTAVEGDLVVIDWEATDADDDNLEVTFDDPFDEDGMWQTSEGDQGEYEVEVSLTDGIDEVSRLVRVTVVPANQPPVIEIASTLTFDEGDTIDLEDEADVSDPDGDDVEVSYSGWMDDSRYTTGFDDAGEYEVTITASDGVQESSVDVTIVVNNVNRPPVFLIPA